ncbi:MAG: hypothetical protein ACFFC7_10890 [Candidatus Hermodarchaeota archaeon]
MIKKLFPLIIILVFLLANTLSGLGMLMLVIPEDGVPFPATETTIYLSTINVLVVLEKDMATINASYTFKNSGQEDTVKIYLPYGYDLESLFLQKDDITITELSRSNVTLEWWSEYYDFNCIYVNVTLKENEQTEFFLHYQRSYHQQDAELGKANYYSFGYLIGPRNRWNHSLESNKFEIHITKQLQPSGFKDSTECSVSETSDYLILSYTYSNDETFGDQLYVGWMVDKEIFVSGFESVYLFSSLLFMTIIYLLKSKNVSKRSEH